MNSIPHLLNRGRAIIALIIMVVVCFHPQPVNASCIDPGGPEAAFNGSDAVFTGGVVYISSANGLWMHGVTKALISLGFHPADFQEKIFPGRRIVFEVDRSWKGVTTSS